MYYIPSKADPISFLNDSNLMIITKIMFYYDDKEAAYLMNILAGNDLFAFAIDPSTPSMHPVFLKY